jgi:uncharacterized protein (TIGR03437 family)
MFQDSSLAMPSGYPKCSGDPTAHTGDCAFVSNKVIAARSYVKQLAAGSAPTPAADSRPDDYTPRDRDGHGTAVASCAAGNTATGVVTVNGMAPKAYLGNYKIYGSPEVNDFTTDDVIIQALNDAISDGMDIVSFSSGGPAFTGPLATGAACGNPAGVACDLVAQAFENAARAGVVIVAAAGNDGLDAKSYPNYSSIESPGSAPSVIAAGATTNSHQFGPLFSVPGGPSNLQNISMDPGDSNLPTGALTLPLIDVSQSGNDGLACAALPAGSLAGAMALVIRGSCTFEAKAINVENAGGLGIVIMNDPTSPPASPALGSAFIPAAFISNADGMNLRAFIDDPANKFHPATIDPNATEQNATGNLLAGFSSVGPSTADYLVKPDVVAPGTRIYMAAEKYDMLGVLYSSNGWAVADGTSFSTPIVSGAAALVKQNHPTFSAAQIRSALINTASQDVTRDDQGSTVDTRQTGAGKLDAGAAAGAALTASPTAIAFGLLTAGSLPKSQQVQITNTGSSAVTLAIGQAPTGVLTLDKPSLTLAPGASGTVTATLQGTVPLGGAYSGAVTVQSASSVVLRVPYLFLVGNGTLPYMFPMTGINNDGTVGQPIPDGILSFKLVDQFGAPIAGSPVVWSVGAAGGTLRSADAQTDQNGIATAQAILGATPGTYTFRAVAGGQSNTFTESARAVPAVAVNGSVVGVASAAKSNPGSAVAPGSYAAIYGNFLSDFTDWAPSLPLPLAIDFVHVSFDVPSASISVPAHLLYVSPTQVNVQIPWELQGQTSAQMKVSIDFTDGGVVNVPLSDFAPAIFEFGTTGMAAAQDLSFNPIGTNHPAVRGQQIVVYVSGLGPVSNQPATGNAASSSPLSATTSAVTVSIGGQSGAVVFSGLTPTTPGLYQVNVTVPTGIASGTQPITVSVHGQTSLASNIVVQ